MGVCLFMRAVLKSLTLEPDPSTLPSSPADFTLLARMIIGSPGTSGEESFDLTVCTPEWLSGECRRVGGIYNARHHLVVNLDLFDRRALQTWLAARVQGIEADTWSELGAKLSRLGLWEFEDYIP